VPKVKVPDDRYHVFVRRVKKRKESAGQKTPGAKVRADTEPEYRMKPNTGGIKRGLSKR
jgi:hypothetical protein